MNTEGPATREMPITHRIFRRQFAEVRALVPEVPTAHATRVSPVAEHLSLLLDGLHTHHHRWPPRLRGASCGREDR